MSTLQDMISELENKISWQERYKFNTSFLIAEIRIAKGWTQKELARRMKTKQSAIARLERGTSLPSHKSLIKLAEVSGKILLPPRLSDKPKQS